MASQRITLPYVTNLTFRRQADFVMRWTMRDADKVLINNTNYAYKMQLRKSPGEAIVKEFTTAAGHFIHGGANGQIQLKITAATIGTIEPGTYQYDIREVDPLSVPRYLFAGKVFVVLMVTEI